MEDNIEIEILQDFVNLVHLAQGLSVLRLPQAIMSC